MINPLANPKQSAQSNPLRSPGNIVDCVTPTIFKPVSNFLRMIIIARICNMRANPRAIEDGSMPREIRLPAVISMHMTAAADISSVFTVTVFVSIPVSVTLYRRIAGYTTYRKLLAPAEFLVLHGDLHVGLTPSMPWIQH